MKSKIVAQVAKELGLPVIDIKLRQVALDQFAASRQAIYERERK